MLAVHARSVPPAVVLTWHAQPVPLFEFHTEPDILPRAPRLLFKNQKQA